MSANPSFFLVVQQDSKPCPLGVDSLLFAMFHLFFVLRARTLFVDLDRVPHLVSRGGSGPDINRPLPGHIEVKRPVIHPWCVAGLSLDRSHVMRHRHRWHASVHHELGVLNGLLTVFP